MKEIFQRLPLENAIDRRDAAERSASRWATTTVITALLLWVWARSPSFDIVPAFVGTITKVAAIASYGLWAPVDSFVFSASWYINLGYAIVFGPLVILTLVFAWYRRERNAIELDTMLLGHQELRGVPGGSVRRETLRRQRRGRLVTVSLGGVVVVASSVALLIRFTDLRAYPGISSGEDSAIESYCARIAKADPRCMCSRLRVDPWPEANNRRTWWFPSSEWCVPGGSGELRNFRAMLPSRFLERQMESQSLDVNLDGLLGRTADRGEGSTAVSFVLGGKRPPYESFPHIYPLPTLWLNTFVALLTSLLLCRIAWENLPLRVGREKWGVSRLLRRCLLGARVRLGLVRR